jgi:ribose transport system permease protein
MYLGLAGVIIVFALLSPYFLSVPNLLNILVQSSIIAIIAAGQTCVILTGGIDLSVGSIVAFASVSAGLMMRDGMSMLVVWIIVIAIGMSIGAVNGSVISFSGVPPFIMTLGMMGIARGAALALNGGMPVSGFPPHLERIASASVMGLPVFVVYTAVVYVIMAIVLNSTKTGRYLYAVGGNKPAARLSGVNVRAVEVVAYVFSGLFAAIGGMLLTARLNYATPLAGTGYELDTVAAVVIGGTALSGGKGGVTGTLIGALMLGTLRNGLTLLNVSSYYQQITIGFVIILAVFFDKASERGRE